MPTPGRSLPLLAPLAALGLAACGLSQPDGAPDSAGHAVEADEEDVMAATTIPDPVVSGAAPSDPVESLLWHARPVVLFAPSPDDPRLQAQLATLRDHRLALQDRRMPVIQVTGGLVRSETYHGHRSGSADQLRERFNVDPDAFVVLLIGLDGDVKRRSATPVEPGGLFDQVDRMPMRRAELAERRDP